MTLRKGVLILALLTASEFIFIACTEQSNTNLYLTENTVENPKETILISEFDQIMRQQAQNNGLDWRLLAAIGYHESRFRNDVVSPVGAIGVMQIMPSVARNFGVSVEQVKDPSINIATAVRIIKSIESSMRFTQSVSQPDRLRTILACYNGGIGHVMDARRLAAKNGASHTNWSEISKYLQLKGSPEYIEDDAVQCGTFASSETINFVKVVMEQYQKYCSQYPA